MTKMSDSFAVLKVSSVVVASASVVSLADSSQKCIKTMVNTILTI